jgi:glycosyltransferase involved in cell wall biosynthesis
MTAPGRATVGAAAERADRATGRRLTVVHTECSKGWGGQEIRILAEARGVAARGHRVVVIGHPEGRLLERAREAGLAVRALRMRNSFDLAAIAALARILRKERADVVNTHSSTDAWIGAFAAKLTAVALVRTRHVSILVRRHVLNFVHRMPAAVITTGEAVRARLVADLGLPAQRVVSIPTGIDTEFFRPQPRPEELRQRLAIPRSAAVVASVAVLRRKKRHDVLLHAVAELCRSRDVHCVLAGEGSQRRAIESMARDLDLTDRVHLLGHVEDVRAVLNGSDVVVSCSSGMEGVPQAVIQALAMTRAVVATDDGAVRELIEDGRTGLLVPPNRPRAVAEAVERFLREPGFARECGRLGREHALRHYSQDEMVDRVLRLYEAVLARAFAPPRRWAPSSGDGQGR